MDGKIKSLICLGCLIFTLSPISGNLLAADYQTVIVASRVMAGDNHTDNDGTTTDLCMLDAQLNDLCDTDDLAGYKYNGVATGNFTYDGVAEAVVCVFDIPDNATADNSSFTRMYQLFAQDNISWYGDTDSVDGYIYVDIVSYDMDPNGRVDLIALDEWFCCGQRPVYRHINWGNQAWPASSLRGYDVQSENPQPDFQNILDTTSYDAAGGIFQGIDLGKLEDGLGFGPFFDYVVTCRASWKGYGLPDADPDNRTDVYEFYWSQHMVDSSWSVNRTPAAYRDVVCADVDDDGYDEILTTVDRHWVIDDDTGQPYRGYVEMFDGWDMPGGAKWYHIGEGKPYFVGAGKKISAGQFDADNNEEFVITVHLYGPDNQTVVQSEIRVYGNITGDNITGYTLGLVAESINQPGTFTALETHDFDGDGIDEIIVGYLHADGQTSSIRIYDASAVLLDESDKYTGYFTGLAVSQIPGGSEEPTTCVEVWSMGYGMQTDLDQTCKIDWGDFSVFANQWLDPNCGTASDFDGSCLVDWVDFAIFANTWLDCNDPENMPPCIANW